MFKMVGANGLSWYASQFGGGKVVQKPYPTSLASDQNNSIHQAADRIEAGTEPNDALKQSNWRHRCEI